MKTKSELEKEGWLFFTADGGAKMANHKEKGTFSAKTLRTLRQKLSNL